MFTGIIQAIGTLRQIEARGGDSRITIDTGTLPLGEAKLGDSIAVNGVCLTAVALDGPRFSADLSRETLSRTTLGRAAIGDPVNLELALLPTTRLGGHLVSGHVDGLGIVTERRDDGRSWRFTIEAPPSLARYIAEKGSMTVNGISLTVNTVHGSSFDVNIVPHTLKATTLGSTHLGDKVNLEVDLIARYLERLLLGDRASETGSGVTMQLLNDSGFAPK
ncbi:MAG: riboflavin synthase [Gammaproteobacteria bacterium]|nr:riboflavin synthase [Gammaproteobacteria bacterium]